MFLIKAIDQIVDKTKLPDVDSFLNELKKIGVLRVLMGLVLVVRYWQIAHTIYVYNGSFESIQLPLLFIILSLFLTIGFLTPLVSIILLAYVNYVDTLFNTTTLGTSILTTVLLCFVLVNSGQFYSIDRLITKGDGFISNVVKTLHKIIGARETKDIKRAYFISFIIYAVISCGALLLHVEDDNWTNGITTKSLLLNTYLCKYFEFFRWFDAHFPAIFSAISILSGIFQSLFQFFMIPLIFTTLGRRFVFLWGLLFYIISLLFINLSYLPHVEIILWTLIFLPTKKSKAQIQIFYDDHCNLCKKSMLFFKSVNLTNRLVFIPISNNNQKYERYGIKEKQVKSYMAGIYKETVYIGYDLYALVFRKNPVLVVFYPVLFIGKFLGIGKRIYNFIAERRYRYFGICEFSTNDIIAAKEEVIISWKQDYLLRFTYAFYSFVTIAYIFFNFNYINRFNFFSAENTRSSKETIRLIGLDLPDVFNKTDLAMGDMWMEVYRIENGDTTLIPFSGEKGVRLNYSNFDFLNFTNHNSDILYFNTTLRFRRYIKGQNSATFFEAGNYGYNNLNSRIIYDYNINEFYNEKTYFIKLKRSDLDKVEISTVPTEYNPIETVFQEKFKFNKEHGLIKG